MIADRVLGPRIRMRNVCLDEGRERVLDAVSCEFAAAQWHAILGPNGGGKSSLLKTLLGLKAHEGSVEIAWSAAPDATGDRRDRVGYVPQLEPFDASLPISVADYLHMASGTRAQVGRWQPSEAVVEGLGTLRLDDKLGRRLGDLSGGERQRLLLLGALMLAPCLLLLDEPMSGLDADGRDATVALLARFRDAGGTILMVEHDWDLVRARCDHVYWLDRSLRAHGPAADMPSILPLMTGGAIGSHSVAVASGQ
ncbi:MAG: ATP-binding cassette domain-containing protein [Pseudomonadota bacterium]